MIDEEYMNLALEEAKKSLKSNDVPVGAIIVKDGKILSKAHNEKVKKRNALFHAEILAILKASKKLKSDRLDNAIIYTTKEPCLMCMGAILSAKLKCVVFGASDPRFGTKELATENKFNHKCKIIEGVRSTECAEILSKFFKKIR